MVKKLILVTSPPACGKTYISKALAKRLQHVVYLDKDTLITLSKQIFVVAGQPYDRSSDFFEKNIRDYEYECVVDLAMETSVYKGYKRDKIEMRGDRAEISDFPLYLNTVAGGLDCRDQTIGGFSFVVKIYAVPVVEIIG